MNLHLKRRASALLLLLTLLAPALFVLLPNVQAAPPDPDMRIDYLGYATFEDIDLGWVNPVTDDAILFDYIESPLYPTLDVHVSAGDCYIVSGFTDSYGTSPPTGDSSGKVFHAVKEIDSTGDPTIFARIRELHQDAKYYIGSYESKWLYIPDDAMRTEDTWWLGGGLGTHTEAYNTGHPFNTYWCDTYNWMYKKYGYTLGASGSDTRWRVAGGRSTTSGSFPAVWWNYVLHETWHEPLQLCDYWQDANGWHWSYNGVYGLDTVNYPNAVKVGTPHEVPINRWFRVETWLKRATDDTGEYMIWITDPKDGGGRHLLFGVTNIRTAYHLSGVGRIWYCWLEQRGNVGDVYMDDLYYYNYPLNEPPSTPEPPQKPNAGVPHVSLMGAGMTATVSSVAAVDNLYAPLVYLDSWILEHNATGTPQNITGSFAGEAVPPPAIIMTFDDNDASLNQIVLDNMTTYGYKGVACINCTKSGAEAIAQDMADAGWEIASHTMTHGHLNSMTSAELLYEVRDSQTWLYNNIEGSYPIITFVYPYGEGRNNSTVLDVVDDYYLLGRHAWTDAPWDGDQNWAIPVYEMTNTTYSDNIAEAIDEAVGDPDNYAVLMFHAVEDPETTWGAITPEMFEYVLDQINQSGLPVTTFKGAYFANQTAQWSAQVTLPSETGKIVQFRAWVNDTRTSINASWTDDMSEPSIRYITTTDPYAESDPPWVGNLLSNSTTCDTDAEITAMASDDVGLSGFIIGTNNGSGTFTNQSWTDPWGGNPLSGSFSHVYRLNATNQTLITVRVYVNDTHDQWSWNELQFTVYDLTPPPQIPNSGFPQTNCSFASGVANISSVASCDSSRTLSHAVLRHNNTGSWANYTYAFSGTTTSETWYFVITLDSTIGKKVIFTAWANDSAGVWSLASTNLTITLQQTPPPSEPPYVLYVGCNSTTISMDCLVAIVASDDEGLSHWRVGTNNGSVTWVNQTWVAFDGTPTFDIVYHTYLLNTTIGTSILFGAWVNDTDGQISYNELRITTIDYFSPSILSLTHNTTQWQSSVLFRARFTDSYGIEGLIFSCNNTGSWMNSTYQTATGNPSSWTWNSSGLNSSFTVINSELWDRIEYKVYVNNTKGKWSTSLNQFFVSGGYRLYWAIRTQDYFNVESYITWTLHNATSGESVNYTEGYGVLYSNTDYELRIRYKGDLMRTEVFNITTADISRTITLDAYHMPALSGFIVTNSTATLTLQMQTIWRVKFTATGSSGSYLIKVDSLKEPRYVFKNSVVYENWTYNGTTYVTDITTATLSTFQLDFGVALNTTYTIKRSVTLDYIGFGSAKTPSTSYTLELNSGVNIRPNPCYCLENFALYMAKNGIDYFVNVTAGENVTINIWYWFEDLGTTSNQTVLEVTSTGNYTIQLYVGNLGKPAYNYTTASVSMSFNNVTNVLTISGSGLGTHTFFWAAPTIGLPYFIVTLYLAVIVATAASGGVVAWYYRRQQKT